MSTPRDRIEAKLGLTGPALQTVRDSRPIIPDHELIRRIGQGAYGDVWLARNALGTWRAVKIVYRDNFKDARPYDREFAGIRRFEPLSRSNEGFVDILQVGRNDADGWFYYVMELADPTEPQASHQSSVGQPSEFADTSGSCKPLNPEALKTEYSPRTLSGELHSRGRLPLEDCLQLGLTLTLALGHLHRHGLIHRDVKPPNIIFVSGVPKLADIGLVTEAAGANTFVGTEGFIPPEGPTSAQADLYALGKVLYEAAMGKDRNEFPEPFSQISTDRESIALMELNVILLRACAPDPKNRYASAEEMHADLALLHSGGSVKGRHQFERQFRMAKQVGALAVGAMLLIGAAWFWQQQQTHKMTRLAEEKATLADEKTKLVDNLTKLDAENRNRIVRLDIANGVRLLDGADPSGALLWFADALPLLTNNPAQEAIHRIRIQQTLDGTPRVLRVFPHESSVSSAAFSPDGRLVATGTSDGRLRVWNAQDGALLWGPKTMGADVEFLRFSRDGKRLFASSSGEQWAFHGGVGSPNFYTVLEPESGRELFPFNEANPALSTNLICSHFSPDDRWLATAQKDNCIRVFDLADGRLVTELRGHTDQVRFLSFSTDGTLLASASLDQTVRLWCLPSGETVCAPLQHRFPVVRVLLTGDGQHLISGSFENPGRIVAAASQAGEGEVQAWETATGQRLGDPLRHRDWLLMYLNPTRPDRYFASEAAYTFADPGQPLFELEASGVQSWDFNPDDRRLALGGNNVARIFNLTTGELVAGPFPHVGELHAVQFSPSGQQLLTASGDWNARLWSLSGSPRESASRKLPVPLNDIDPVTLEATVGRLPGLTPVPLQTEIALLNDELQETVRFPMARRDWGLDGLRPAWRANLWVSKESEPDKKAVVLWRPQGADPGPVLLQHEDDVSAAAFTPDDQFLITSCRDGTVRLWKTTDGGLAKSVTVQDGGEGWIPEISPDGRIGLWLPRHLNERPIFRFVDLESGRLLNGAHALPQRSDFYIRFAPDGRQMAIWDFSGAVAVVECPSGRRISSSIQHSGNLSWVEWDPDGRRLLTAGANDEVLVWDVQTGLQLVSPLQTPGAANRIARWSLDGRFIITRNDDRKVRVWDASKGEAVTPLLKHSGDVAFPFLTQSNRLITASHPDLLRAWALRPSLLSVEVLVDYARLLSSRRLGPSGALLTMKPEELAELCRSLRARATELFATP